MRDRLKRYRGAEGAEGLRGVGPAGLRPGKR